MVKVTPSITRDLLMVYAVLWVLQLWIRRERKKDPGRVIMNERLGWVFIAVYSVALVGVALVNSLAP